MPINQFGVSLEKSRAARMDYYKWSGLLRNYMRVNLHCVPGADFDGKSRKIRRLAQPTTDSNAVNKLYVENSSKLLREQQEDLERKLVVFQREILTLQNTVQKISQVSNSIPQQRCEGEWCETVELVQNFLGPMGST